MAETLFPPFKNSVVNVFVDYQKNLECNYDQFYLLSMKNNPNVTHWNNFLDQ